MYFHDSFLTHLRRLFKSAICNNFKLNILTQYISNVLLIFCCALKSAYFDELTGKLKHIFYLTFSVLRNITIKMNIFLTYLIATPCKFQLKSIEVYKKIYFRSSEILSSSERQQNYEITFKNVLRFYGSGSTNCI